MAKLDKTTYPWRAWEIEDALIRGLRRQDVVAMLDLEKRRAALFTGRTHGK